MIDKTIPYYNLILRLDAYEKKRVNLPSGFRIESYKVGYEKDWARLEVRLGDFKTLNEAEDYFRDTYLKEDKDYDRLHFLVKESGEVIGSCISWKDNRQGEEVSSLHWLVVEESYHGCGLGRALTLHALNTYDKGEFPVYIHTQPWSYKAIGLYLSLGFKLQKTDTFSDYVNEYEEGVKVLRKLLIQRF